MPLFPLILLFPLLGLSLNAILGRRVSVKVSGTIASAAVFLSFLVALSGLRALFALPPEERVIIYPLWDWIQAGGLDVSLALRLDPLSALMSLVVTGVGFLIHVYSIG